ncbi:MAG: MotA/TolQ/ExbB proton channel family protein [Rhodomicrobium sp.]
MEPALIGAPAAHLNIVDLIRNADPIVQGVMLVLSIASTICWAIILEKAIRLLGFGGQVRHLERAAGEPVKEAGGGAWLAGAVLNAARSQKFSASEGRSEIEAGLEKAMRRAARIELNRLQPRIRFLATVGSTAPFVGLFGTVWGIMNSFSAIAQQKDTSLAVVAPGIAEALFATALGLVAAIPAVVAYNQISGSVSRASERINLAIAALANGLVQRAAIFRSEV